MNLSTFEPNAGLLEVENLQRIEELVIRELRGRLIYLHLGLRDDGIVLQGKVGSFYAKQLALHAVMKATNLPIRENEITVVPS